MITQNNVEVFSNQPPPHIDLQHAINIPDCGSDNSASPPTHGYPPDHKDFPGSKVNVDEEQPLGFFGLGYGWGLFILGFFLLAVPWFIGAVIFLIMVCYRANPRDKYGYLSCFIAAIVISIILDSYQRVTCNTECISEGVNFS